jgi:hypothetical protein
MSPTCLKFVNKLSVNIKPYIDDNNRFKMLCFENYIQDSNNDIGIIRFTVMVIDLVSGKYVLNIRNRNIKCKANGIGKGYLFVEFKFAP